MKVTVPYIGAISCNSYKVYKKGFPIITTKPEVKVWMAKLAWAVAQAQLVSPVDLSGKVIIGIWGHFRDNRNRPDEHNLHKVIGDAIKVGLGIDDKDFLFADLGFSTGDIEPTLDITISEKMTDIRGGN